MKHTVIQDHMILFSRQGELVRLSACAEHAIRFQSFPDGRVTEENYTLLPQPRVPVIREEDHAVFMTSGNLTVRLEENGKITFFRCGRAILEEKCELTFETGYRNHQNIGSGLWRSRVTFCPHPQEHFYGLGHSWDHEFDLKGCSFDIRNLNAKCTIPYVYSSRGYGFIWNLPSTGTVELSNNRTRWQSDCCYGIDYVVIAGDPKQTASVLADLTGHAPEMPYWATGFWQSRLRYETQEELLSVARRYHREQIPVSAMVADYFHWTEQGDYRFDSQYWPNVKEMADQLHDMDMKLVVSVWPTINENSENYEYMSANNMLMRTVHGSDRVFRFYGWQAEIDVTNPKTREYVWSKLRQNYIDNGVDALWFDEAEPEIHPEQFDNLIWHAGRADRVALLYPYYYSQLAYDGFRSMGQEQIVTLTRCAYLGSQKFGSLVWSGDIPSTFDSLSHQVKAGLNMAMCGIPWWNTDIGGFYGGDTQNEEFRELMVRWFQFGVFSPVMRLHGSRIRHGEPGKIIEPSGDPNELWSFGEEVYGILKNLVMLRQRLRPYIARQMQTAARLGYPVMRPMFFEYPDDPQCYELAEQYMFGDDILFAPIVNRGQTEKQVYLPAGEWILTKDGCRYGQGFHTVKANLSEFIAFVKADAAVAEVL